MLCGSASAHSRQLVQTWMSTGRPVLGMPQDLFNDPSGPDLQKKWAAEIAESIRLRGSAILAIPQSVAASRARAVRSGMAQTFHALMSGALLNRDLSVCMEGGATAAAVVDVMNWQSFAVEGNLAPGVVVMRPDADRSISLIIKPGSYPWPQSLLSKVGGR